MQIKIGRKVYNTEKSKEVTRKLVSYFGDSHGYEEVLYHKKDDEFFLYGQGGEHSIYAEPSIKVLTPEETLSWLAAILGEPAASDMMRKFTVKKKRNSRSAAANSDK